MSNPKNANHQKCGSCGGILKKGRFQCPHCHCWNPRATASLSADDGTLLLSDVSEDTVQRIATGPWDVNFGCPPGIPNNAVVLIGGIPGAGKSTVALQWCEGLARGTGREILYLPAEEAGSQIKERALRLQLSHLNKIRIVPLEKMTGEGADISIPTIFERRRLGGVVLDSIGGFTTDLEHAVELVTQFKFYATVYKMPFLIINHVTKDGDMAGLMRLQHAGDISLMLTKGEKGVEEKFRIPGETEIRKGFELREIYTEKSRYGKSGISTFYEMTEQGLRLVEAPQEDGD